MFPGMNSRQAQQMMRKMGINQQEFEASEVIIKLPDKQLVFKNPSVTKMNIMGENMYQITGTPEEQEYEVETQISEDDIKTVMDQTHVSREKALAALEEASGDIAAAILQLQ